MIRVLVFGMLLFVAASAAYASSTALAHEDRESGKLKFVVGFINEPAFEGFKNGVSLRVMREAEAAQGVPAEHHHGEGAVMDPSDMHGVNIEEHGMLFVSPALAHQESFSYQAGHDLMGMTVPYHSHLNHDLTGSFTVNMDADLSGMVDIEIRDGIYHPSNLTVKPGTTLIWTNHDNFPQNITSGSIVGMMGSHDNSNLVPMEGLETQIQVEVTHVPSGASKIMALRAVFGEPGHYTADLIPTAPGQYSFRFFGIVDGKEIDETFQSGQGRFDDVQVAEVLQFPESLPAVREMVGAVRGAQASAAEAQNAASSANTLGILGIVLGAVGIVTGAGGLALGLRKR